MVRTAAVVAVVAVGLSAGAAGLVAGPVPGRVDAASAPSPPPVVAEDATAQVRAQARTYTLPLDPPVVVARPFDGPARPWEPGHRGVDLATHPGAPVRAPEGGVVTFAGTVVDRGVVTVTHDDGLRSSLEPVAWTVARGQRVLGGQTLGTVAASAGHCAPATCLHWGLRRGETYLDPMRWVLDRGPIVLLPEGSP